MKKKNTKDITEIIKHITSTINNRPSVNAMLDEIKLMRFKIRPVHGDFSLVDLRNVSFIETIWSLGKLDDLFQKVFRLVNVDEREMLFKIYDDLSQKLQQQLNKIKLRQEKPVASPQLLEMEIFKERLNKKKIN